MRCREVTLCTAKSQLTAMPVVVDDVERKVASERNSTLKIRITTGHRHTFHRNLTDAGILETDEEMGARVQQEVDAMRAPIETTAVRAHPRLLDREAGEMERVLLSA